MYCCKSHCSFLDLVPSCVSIVTELLNYINFSSFQLFSILHFNYCIFAGQVLGAVECFLSYQYYWVVPLFLATHGFFSRFFTDASWCESKNQLNWIVVTAVWQSFGHRPFVARWESPRREYPSTSAIILCSVGLCSGSLMVYPLSVNYLCSRMYLFLSDVSRYFRRTIMSTLIKSRCPDTPLIPRSAMAFPVQLAVKVMFIVVGEMKLIWIDSDWTVSICVAIRSLERRSCV